MENDYIKYSDKYARYWFRYLGYDFIDTVKNRKLTKGELHNLYPELCDDLAAGGNLPEQFRLVEREPVKKTVERHGKVYEVEQSYCK